MNEETTMLKIRIEILKDGLSYEGDIIMNERKTIFQIDFNTHLGWLDPMPFLGKKDRQTLQEQDRKLAKQGFFPDQMSIEDFLPKTKICIVPPCKSEPIWLKKDEVFLVTRFLLLPVVLSISTSGQTRDLLDSPSIQDSLRALDGFISLIQETYTIMLAKTSETEQVLMLLRLVEK